MTHSLLLLKSLHWLIANFRNRVQMRLLTFKTLTTQQPTYLHDLLHELVPNRTLCSNSSVCIYRCFVWKMKTGSRVFSCSVPSLWNSLPTSVTVHSAISIAFACRCLNTSLFDLAFLPCCICVCLFWQLSTAHAFSSFVFQTDKHPWTR